MSHEPPECSGLEGSSVVQYQPFNLCCFSLLVLPIPLPASHLARGSVYIVKGSNLAGARSARNWLSRAGQGRYRGLCHVLCVKKENGGHHQVSWQGTRRHLLLTTSATYAAEMERRPQVGGRGVRPSGASQRIQLTGPLPRIQRRGRPQVWAIQRDKYQAPCFVPILRQNRWVHRPKCLNWQKILKLLNSNDNKESPPEVVGFKGTHTHTHTHLCLTLIRSNDTSPGRV